MKTTLLTTIILLFLCACKPQTETQNISIQKLQTLLKQDIQLVDVRTPDEWEKGIINTALKISVTSEDFEQKAEKMLNKEKPVYLYCRTEGRSSKAVEILREKGYNAFYVTGGYNDWKNKIEE